MDSCTYTILMPDLVSGFDWDHGNRLECQKHGLTIAEIEAVFAGTMWVSPAATHTAAELGTLALGARKAGDMSSSPTRRA